MGTLDFAGIEQIMTQALMAGWALGAGNAIRDAKRIEKFADPAWWNEFETEYQAATATVDGEPDWWADFEREYAAHQQAGTGFGPQPFSPLEAARWIQKRVPLSLRRLRAALEAAGKTALELTKDLVNSIAEKIDTYLAEHVVAGADMGEFLRALDDVAGVVGLTAADPFYWETVFRTNVQTAYGAGKYEIQRTPEMEAAFGFYQYLTVGDSAVRPSHAALHGRVWKANDPAVDEFWPPLGFNCRCDMVSLGPDEIEAEGLVVSEGAPMLDGERVRPDPGFEGPPVSRFEVKR